MNEKIGNENNWELIIQFYECFLFFVALAVVDEDHLIPVFIEFDSNFESTPHQNGCNKITRNYCVWRKKRVFTGTIELFFLFLLCECRTEWILLTFRCETHTCTRTHAWFVYYFMYRTKKFWHDSHIATRFIAKSDRNPCTHRHCSRTLIQTHTYSKCFR